MKTITYPGDKSICVYPGHVPKVWCKSLVRPIRNGCPSISDYRLDEGVFCFLSDPKIGVLPHYYSQTKLHTYLPKLVPKPQLMDFGYKLTKISGREKIKFNAYDVWPTILSVFIVVNTPKLGGEFEFLHQNIHYKPTLGDIIIFPAGWSYIFKINRVEQGMLGLVHTGITLDSRSV